MSAQALATSKATPGPDGGQVVGAPGLKVAEGVPDLSIRGLKKSFNGREVLKGVDLTLDTGGTVSLLGGNGSGKSTLMRCCLRLIEPDAGAIQFFGEPITGQPRRSVRKMRAGIGFVFQKHFLVTRLSALTNVLHGVQARHSGPRSWHQSLARQSDREEALACLDRVGLADIADRRVDQLSGGQSQRVAIARALMQQPRLLMADEPAASLDPQAAEDVMDLFNRLARDEGLTLIYTTHNLAHALAYSDRVVVLRHGQIAHEGKSGEQNIGALRRFYEHEDAAA